MVLATFATRHFTFRGAGSSREQALAALRVGWEAHVASTGADPDLLEPDDVSFLVLEPTMCYRDETLIAVNGIPTAG